MTFSNQNNEKRTYKKLERVETCPASFSRYRGNRQGHTSMTLTRYPRKLKAMTL